jgi:phasin family protein
MNEMFKPTVDALNTGVTTVMTSLEKTKADVTVNMQKSMKTAEEMLAFGQGNFAAFTTSGQILAAGAQELSKTIASQAQAQVQETVAAMKSFAGVTSVQGVLDLQTAFARSALARAAAEATRLSEASQKLAADALSPITARVNLAAETFSRAA